jgi:uncharacterized membrane protein
VNYSELYMAKKKSVKKKTTKKSVKKVAKKAPVNDDGGSTLFAFLATFLSIVGFLIALAAKRDDKYVMFYARQSLVLFVVAIAAAIVDMILAVIPILGWIVGVALNVLVLILWILSWAYALSGKEKDVPIIGEWARKINL